nr:hypothetical protein [uncultured Schaedlerella sp.]
MRSRTSIWGISSLLCGKARSPKPQPDRAGIPGVPTDWGIGEQREEVKVGMEFDRGT